MYKIKGKIETKEFLELDVYKRQVYTCLEVVYNDQVNLPITQDNENFIADEVIYAIYANSDAANVVSINGSIFGSINESNLSGIIEEYVLTNLQTTDFNGEQVTVGSITTTYSSIIPDKLLSFIEPKDVYKRQILIPCH